MSVLKNLKQSTLVLMLIIVISKLMGMLRDIVLANYFGTSNVSDAYLIAISVPTLLFYFIGHALSTAYLPMYNKIRYDKGETEAQKYSNNLICISFCLCTIIVVVLIFFPEAVIKLFAAGFDDDTVELTAKFIRYSAASIYFMTIVNIWGGYLQANNNFIIPASISVPRNIVLIISIVVALYDIKYLGIGILIAYISEFLLLLPFVIKNGFRFRPIIELKTPEIKETLYLVLPIIIGVGVSQINKIIDRSIASTVISGGISALNYASIINNAVQEVLVTGIITILFAKCAAWVAEKKYEKVKSKLSETIDTLIFFLVPATLGIIVCSESIVRCILCRGAFDMASVNMTVGALCCYTIGLVFLAIRDTMVKVFYAYKDTKITTATSIGAILINIILNLVLSHFWGINGLAIATSISVVIQCVVLYLILRRKIGDFGFLLTLKTFIKSLISSVIMSVVIIMLINLLSKTSIGEFISLMICVLTGILVYFLCSIILKSHILLDYWIMLKNKLNIINKKGDSHGEI